DAASEVIRMIRDTAVTDRLTRQITRLLETAERLAERQGELADKMKRRAAVLLGRAHAELEKATGRRRCGPKAQAQLAERLRERRQRLEKLLEKHLAGRDDA